MQLILRCLGVLTRSVLSWTRLKTPDEAIASWLEHGAPFGVAQEIRPGGLLPLITETAALSADQLYELDSFKKNHGSFNEEVDGAKPAMEELQTLVDQGFARIFEDEVAAEEWLWGQARDFSAGECGQGQS